jgi:hypothetical protein
VLKKFIDPQIIYVHIEKAQLSLELLQRARQLQKHLFPSCCWQEFVIALALELGLQLKSHLVIDT